MGQHSLSVGRKSGVIGERRDSRQPVFAKLLGNMHVVKKGNNELGSRRGEP